MFTARRFIRSNLYKNVRACSTGQTTASTESTTKWQNLYHKNGNNIAYGGGVVGSLYTMSITNYNKYDSYANCGFIGGILGFAGGLTAPITVPLCLIVMPIVSYKKKNAELSRT